jgi:hypothetical protein
MVQITLSRDTSTCICHNYFIFHLIYGIEKEGEKGRIFFNMAVLCRTSVKMYVFLCACDFLFGEREETSQLGGLHKVQNFQHCTFSGGGGLVVQYLFYHNNVTNLIRFHFHNHFIVS